MTINEAVKAVQDADESLLKAKADHAEAEQIVSRTGFRLHHASEKRMDAMIALDSLIVNRQQFSRTSCNGNKWWIEEYLGEQIK